MYTYCVIEKIKYLRSVIEKQKVTQVNQACQN